MNRINCRRVFFKQSGPSNSLLQPLSRLVCLPLSILLIILIIGSQSAYALDLALKTGYTWYSEEKESEYIGNTCYDSEMSSGAFVRFVRDNWIVRFDYDKNRTGNTLLNPIPYPYEQIKLTQHNFILSGGRSLGWFYGLIGVGYTHNEGDIEQYPSDPFSYELKDNINYSATLGIEKSWDKFFVFLEGRYLWQDLNIKFPDTTTTENTDNKTIYTGLGWRF